MLHNVIGRGLNTQFVRSKYVGSCWNLSCIFLNLLHDYTVRGVEKSKLVVCLRKRLMQTNEKQVAFFQSV